MPLVENVNTTGLFKSYLLHECPWIAFVDAQRELKPEVPFYPTRRDYPLAINDHLEHDTRLYQLAIDERIEQDFRIRIDIKTVCGKKLVRYINHGYPDERDVYYLLISLKDWYAKQQVD
jgi:hypothetical protein